jgi:RimJ/RimL family protein N-acetyltransferase
VGVGFPLRGDAGAIGGFLRATAARGEQQPFGYFRITRLADGRAVGGIGFKGRPDDDGCVELGYGLVPSARGHRFAAEAVVALLAVAAVRGLSRVMAETLTTSLRKRTLIRAGFHLVGTDDELHHYEVSQSGFRKEPQ